MRRRLTATLLAAVVPCLSLAAQRADTLPLKPTHTVDFTTSEGTWISLDVSPDGQTLVFELLGDLYTLPLKPGKLADLVVLDANPLDDIHNTEKVRYVMKNGPLYDGGTLDEVWPRNKPLPPMWWLDREPKGVK